MELATQQRIQSWLSGNFDPATKADIKRLQEEDPAALEEAFYQNLEFGTGGLRGLMGVGTNRMNKYTVGMATQGYANYLKQFFGDNVKVAYPWVAMPTVYLFIRFVPTPMSPLNPPVPNSRF